MISQKYSIGRFLLNYQSDILFLLQDAAIDQSEVFNRVVSSVCILLTKDEVICLFVCFFFLLERIYEVKFSRYSHLKVTILLLRKYTQYNPYLFVGTLNKQNLIRNETLAEYNCTC